MKRSIHILALLMGMGIITGCASTKGYFVDRGRDAADVFAFTIGRGVGVKAKFGPAQIGLIFNQDVWGLRGGEISCWPAFSALSGTKGDAHDRPVEALLPLPLLFNPDLGIHGGGESYNSHSLDDKRGKTFDAVNILPCIPVAAHIKDDSCYPAWPYYTQIECVVGLGPSVRIGFNPGELLDCVLGWLMIDIYGDDVESGTQRGNSHDNSEAPR